MQIVNMSRPGKDPVDGDTIRKVYSNGATEITTFASFSTAAESGVSVATVEWLRSLGKAEAAIRKYAASDAQYAQDVAIFMGMVSDRASDVLIVSDLDYAAGVEMLHRAELLSTDKAKELLSLGNHTTDQIEPAE